MLATCVIQIHMLLCFQISADFKADEQQSSCASLRSMTQDQVPCLSFVPVPAPVSAGVLSAWDPVSELHRLQRLVNNTNNSVY